MSLTLEGVSFAYGEHTAARQLALDDVTLSVAPGELVIVVGETGSGKSTLLRLLAGLLVPTSGAGTLDDAPLTPAATRGRVGLIFQDAESQLFADTVLEDVMFGPRNLGCTPGEAQERAIAALECVGLAPGQFGARSPFTLSGGEARRAAVAGVLAMRPKYLLADEPTSALDAAGRRAVRDVVTAARRHAGVVVVTHTPEEFMGDADRALVLKDARSTWYGPTRELMMDPAPLQEGGLIVPEILEAQVQFSRRAGVSLQPTFDPVEAARRIAVAGGWIE